jgi:hypothetical protein
MNTISIHRRLCLAALLLTLTQPAVQAQERPSIDVWKSPTCGCCKDWVAHLTDHGFRVNTHDTGNNGIRQRLGMPVKYGACHTARIGDYVIEGHVPAADIIRLLKEKPAALGVAVPGMPIGSPGMDGPAYGDREDAYDVLLVQRDGSASVFKSHPGK